MKASTPYNHGCREYFLGIVLAAYREFETRVGVVTTHKGAKREMVVDVIKRLPKQFQIADVERACPGVSRPTINRVLGQLRKKYLIVCLKSGRDAVWEKRQDLNDFQ
jgi:CRP-like cAMP-binding protein